MIRVYKDGKLTNSMKLLFLKNRADYEYVCKKILLKHGKKTQDFEDMDIEKKEYSIDPYLKAVKKLGYNLKSY